MKKFKVGRFADSQGLGVFVTLRRKLGGHMLFAVRNQLVAFRKRVVYGKPGYTRWYFGPFELEVYRPAASEYWRTLKSKPQW